MFGNLTLATGKMFYFPRLFFSLLCNIYIIQQLIGFSQETPDGNQNHLRCVKNATHERNPTKNGN